MKTSFTQKQIETYAEYSLIEDAWLFNLCYWFRWLWIVRQYHRLVYFIKHGKDDYGKLGFNQLMYKGKPIILRDDVPTGELWMVDKNGKIFKKIKINV